MNTDCVAPNEGSLVASDKKPSNTPSPPTHYGEPITPSLIKQYNYAFHSSLKLFASTTE